MSFVRYNGIKFSLKSTIKKSVCVLLCASAVFCGTFFVQKNPPVLSAAAVTKSELNAKKEAINSKKAQLQKSINSNKAEIAKLEGQKDKYIDEKNRIDKLISDNSELIALCNEELALLKEMTDTLEKDIKDTEDSIEANKQQFKSRLRAMYMSGSYSDLEIILGADDFSDLLLKTELIRKVSEHDSQLIEQIKIALVKLQTDGEELLSKKAEQETVKQTLANKQADLKTQRQKAADLATKIKEEQESINQTMEATQEDLADLDAQLDEVNKQFKALENPSTNSVQFKNYGQFAWPVPACYNITSKYGMRWGRLHAGIDISRSRMNDVIIAAADGVVSSVTYNSGGYGKYLIINHGVADNGIAYATLYAHCNSIAVSAGQSVQKGQVIAYMGNTGNVSGATGIHLHFEIRENGSPKNPENYFR